MASSSLFLLAFWGSIFLRSCTSTPSRLYEPKIEKKYSNLTLPIYAETPVTHASEYLLCSYYHYYYLQICYFLALGRS